MSATDIGTQRIAVTARPHRSHRTLRAARASWLYGVLSLLVGVAVTYVLLQTFWPSATAAIASLLDRAQLIPTSAMDSFVGINATLAIPQLPATSLAGVLAVAIICASVLVAGALLPGRGKPLRYWVLANVLILMFTALWAFFTGNVAYDGAAFMQLLSRTTVLMVLSAPIFAAVVSSLLPFSAFERIALTVLLVLCDAAIALVRLAAFPLLVARFGAVVEPNLYLFFGPLLDVVYFILVYSGALVVLSRRLARDEEAWEWL